jgi:hypothetical protein
LKGGAEIYISYYYYLNYYPLKSKNYYNFSIS